MIRQTQVDSFNKLNNLDGKRKIVYDVITNLNMSTNRMIAKELGWDINRVTGRVTELVNLGLVTSDGTYYDEDTKRTVTLWKALY
jgi:predicted transcriptional regulator